MLSEQDILDLRAALADGRPAMVWFTAKAVGVQAGKSGKVTSFAEPATGDFIEVRPTGSQDTLSFSRAELTATRPKRQPVAKKPEPAKAPEPPVQIYRPAPAQKPEPVVKAPAQAAPAPKTVPAQAKSGRRSKPPAEVTVTLHSTPEGEWTVEVMVGKKRSVRALPVPAVAIAKAAKELPGEVEEAIGAVLAAARQQHQERVAQLQAELEAARRALAELS
jgi:hypothetical protein